MTGTDEPKAKRGAALVRWLKHEWHTPLAIAGAGVTSLSRIPTNWANTMMLIVGVVMVAVSAVGAAINRKRVSVIEDRAVQAEKDRDAARDDLTSVAQLSKAVYRSLLVNIATDLKLGTTERVSLYVHDSVKKSFQLLSRHSPNPSLEDAPGRKVYPDGQGIIGKAWREGWAEEKSLPDPSVGGSTYVADNFQRYGLPTEVTEKLAMKSQVLVASRYPADAMSEKHIGVLVIESVDASWNVRGMRTELDTCGWWETLQQHLRAQRDRIPVLSNAEGKGF